MYFPAIRGGYIEIRVALVRDDPAKQPELYDLTLHGTSSGFGGDLYLDDAMAYETEDAIFYANVIAAEPMGYQWFRMYPW